MQGVRQGFVCSVAIAALSGVGVFSPFVGVGALRVGFDQAPLPFSACPAPKEVNAEGTEACVVTEDLSAACVGVWGSTQKQPKVVSLSLLFCPRYRARL